MTVSAIAATAGPDEKAFRPDNRAVRRDPPEQRSPQRSPQTSPHTRTPRPEPACTITADGMYAARLVRCAPPTPAGGPRTGPGAAEADAPPARFPERWTLGGPEPYRVPLPARRPEPGGSEVQPMGDGRVLIHRTHGHRHTFTLLHPTSPGTREIPLGALDCPARDRPQQPAPQAHTCGAVRLLPPVPGGRRAYALAAGAGTTQLWLVAGDPTAPRRLTELPGHCSGGVWLDRTGHLLAVDREHGGRTKAVTVDLRHDAAVTPLLEITEDSNDRLLLADPDSGLLIIRSDAPSPGHERLAWGVLGSTLPVRFPEALRLPDCALTPFAVQPGQALTPERGAVALRVDGAAGTWLGVWRPAERTLHHAPAPDGWLTGSGVWTRDGMLHLPYTTPSVPCGLARIPAPPPPRSRWVRVTGTGRRALGTGTTVTDPQPDTGPRSDPPSHAPARPVPLRDAPLAGPSATRSPALPVLSAPPAPPPAPTGGRGRTGRTGTESPSGGESYGARTSRAEESSGLEEHRD